MSRSLSVSMTNICSATAPITRSLRDRVFCRNYTVCPGISNMYYSLQNQITLGILLKRGLDNKLLFVLCYCSFYSFCTFNVASGEIHILANIFATHSIKVYFTRHERQIPTLNQDCLVFLIKPWNEMECRSPFHSIPFVQFNN